MEKCSRFKIERVDKDGNPDPKGRHLRTTLILKDGKRTSADIDVDSFVLPVGAPPTVRLEEIDGKEVFIFGLPVVL